MHLEKGAPLISRIEFIITMDPGFDWIASV